MQTTHPLTDNSVLRYICEFHRDFRQMPTIREVHLHFGHRSPTSVQRSFARLLERGDIEKDGGRYRLAESNFLPLGLPVVGHIAAGSPTEAIEIADEYVDLGDAFAKSGHFALRVQGDSMIEAHIVSGDIAVIRPQETCKDGDIVAVVIDGEATLKFLFRRRDHLLLKPANRKFKSLKVKTVEIRGVMVGLWRRF